MDGVIGNRWRRGFGFAGRLLAGSILAVALTVAPVLAVRSVAAVGGTRGEVTVKVVGANRASGPVCLVLRDLTINMVVGSYCDNDTGDGNPRTGIISLNLPQRSFAVDALAPGVTVASVTPRHFHLTRRQTIVIRLAAPASSAVNGAAGGAALRSPILATCHGLRPTPS
jgi:hypothetical protein